MSEFSFANIANLLKKSEKPAKVDGLTAEEWKSEFSNWLETDYQKIVPPPRKPGLHCSGLYEVCPRKEALLELLKPQSENIKAGQTMTFDLGTMMHWWWQHRYLGPKQELWGDWYCSSCKNTVTGLMPLNCSCGADWRISMHYKELGVEDKELKYTGHCDGVLLGKNNQRRVLEFKSCSDSAYKKIIMPKKAHIIQAHGYMRCLGITEALIVYSNKGQQCDWIFESNGDVKVGEIKIKTFLVSYDSALWTEIEKRIKDNETIRKQIVDIIKSGKFVDEEFIAQQYRICTSEEDDAAAYCPVRKECFAMRCDTKTDSIHNVKSKEFKVLNE